MARIFLTAVDLSKNELRNAQVQVLPTTSAPSSPVQGQVYYDSTLKTIGLWETSGTPAWRYAAISGQIFNVDINASAAIAYGKLNLANSIMSGDINGSLKPSGTATAATESLRALGTTGSTAMAGNSTLNAIAAANATTANIAMSGFTFTGLADPLNPQDAATKAYVDTSRAGLDAKASVRVATTADLTSATYNATGATGARGQITGAPTAVDGITLVSGNRVLVRHGVGSTPNLAAQGIYVVTATTTTWDRADDFNLDYEVTAGAYVWVEEGSANQDSAWVLTTDNPIVIGGATGTVFSATAWVLFSSAGSLIAGDGLTKTGNAINAVGTTNRISVAADAIDISVSYVGQTTITTLGNVTSGTWSANAVAVLYGGTGATTAAGARANLGATTKFAVANHSTNSSFSSPTVTMTVTHNLNTTDVIVQMHQVSDGQVVEPTITKTSLNVVTLSWNAASLPADNTYRAVVIG